MALLAPELFVAGVNHRTSTMAFRDRLYVEDDGVKPLLRELNGAGIGEAVVLSTCDRIEVIGAGDAPRDQAARGLDLLAGANQMNAGELRSQAYVETGEAAVRHLFAVASSLDSLIVGEPQVLGQVKAAHRLALETGFSGSGVLERTLQAAYGVAKRVRTETAIGTGPVSIAAAAISSIKDLHGELSGVSVLLIGQGEMGEMVADELKAAGVRQMTVLHPRERRAAAVAKRLGCHHGLLDELAARLPDADVVVGAHGSGRQVLAAADLEAAIKTRKHRPVFVVDTSVPGDVAPAVHDLEDAFLYDLADLERIARAALKDREAAADAAWAIVDEEVAQFCRGQRERQAAPLVTELRARFETERLAALEDAEGDAEKATRLLVARLLHAPSTRLREAAAASDMALADAERLLHHLFGVSAPGPETIDPPSDGD